VLETLKTEVGPATAPIVPPGASPRDPQALGALWTQQPAALCRNLSSFRQTLPKYRINTHQLGRETDLKLAGNCRRNDRINQRERLEETRFPFHCPKRKVRKQDNAHELSEMIKDGPVCIKEESPGIGLAAREELKQPHRRESPPSSLNGKMGWTALVWVGPAGRAVHDHSNSLEKSCNIS